MLSLQRARYGKRQQDKREKCIDMHSKPRLIIHLVHWVQSTQPRKKENQIRENTIDKQNFGVLQGSVASNDESHHVGMPAHGSNLLREFCSTVRCALHFSIVS
jgi:hypothetical protein